MTGATFLVIAATAFLLAVGLRMVLGRPLSSGWLAWGAIAAAVTALVLWLAAIMMD